MKVPPHDLPNVAEGSDTDPSGPPQHVAEGLDGDLDALGGRPRVFVQERAESAGVSGARYYSEAHEPKRLGDAPTLPEARVIVDGTNPGASSLRVDALPLRRSWLPFALVAALVFVAGLVVLFVWTGRSTDRAASVRPQPSVTPSSTPPTMSSATVPMVAASADAKPPALAPQKPVERPTQRPVPPAPSKATSDPKHPADMPWTID